MKIKLQKIYILFMACLLLLACSREKGQLMYTRLYQWDAMLDEAPQAISDSLKQLNPTQLSRANRAYYGLLKTITDDKTYVDFTSDSLINTVRNYYNRYQKGSDNHIRSSVYQGVVRYRMGITDSTALIPLKEAEILFKEQKKQNVSIGYLMNYYLGEILEIKDDNVTAIDYYKKALSFAKKEENVRHCYDAYLTLFWSEMMQGNQGAGKLYLDTLDTFADLAIDARYYLLNAKSVYYNSQQEYEKALDAEKKQMNLLSEMPIKVDEYKIYYSISKQYGNLTLLDSAMHYAKSAVEHITDSTYKLNYMLYENIADVAEKQRDYLTANQYRKIAANTRDKNIQNETDNSLLELEKKYNLAESENKMLKAQRRSRFFTTATITTVLLVLFLYMYFTKQKTLAAIRTKQLEAEKNAAQAQASELEAKTHLIQQQAIIKEQMLNVYGTFLKLYAEEQNLFKGVINKLRGQRLHEQADLLEQMLKNGQQEFSIITAQLFTAEKLRELLNIHSSPDYLNDSERLILFMLACKAENKNIAALLHTTSVSLKARKTQLKKKITDNAGEFPDSDILLSVF